MMCPNAHVRSAAARSAALRWSASSALGHPFRVDDVVGGEQLRLLVLELEGLRAPGQLQHTLGVRDPLLTLRLGGGPLGAVVEAEQLGRLVQQRNVGRCPDVLAGRAPDGLRVRLRQMDRLGQVVGEEALRGERRPQLVDRRVHLPADRDGLPELGDVVRTQEVGPAVRVGADALGELGGQRVDDPEREVRPGQVVGQPGVTGRLPGLVGDLPVQDQVAVVVRDDQRGARLGQQLPVAHGELQRFGHGRSALHRGGRGRVRAARVHAGEELGLRGEQHTGLTERRQHLADVAEEGRVGAHDQDRALGQQLPLLVQQERRPVQRDRGLPGARAALDDEDTAVRRADDAVLLRLDGPHDVGHAAGARGVHRGQQDGVAARVLETGALVVLDVEDLVVQLGDRAALGGDVAAPAQTHRGVVGREIEGTGDRGAPVDQQRRVLGVVLADSDTADMVRGAVREIDAAETERTVDRVQRGQQTRALGDQNIAFEPGLLPGADRRQGVLDLLGGDTTQHVDTVVEPVDEFLLLVQFGAFPS